MGYRAGILVGLIMVLASTTLLMNAGSAYAASTLVQQNNGGCQSCGSNTLSIPFLANVVSGDVIVVGVTVGGGGSVSSPPSDTLGSSFTEANTATNPVNNAYVYVFYATLSSSGADTVSVTFTGSALQNMYIYEVSGVTVSGFGTATGSGSGASSSISTSVAFQPGAFLLGVLGTGNANGSPTAGSGFQLSSDKSGTVLTEGAEWATARVSSPTNFPMSFSPSAWAEVGVALEPTPATCIATATGSATACAETTPGVLSGLTAVSASSTSPPPPSGLTFPYGLFSITQTGLSPGQIVTVTITLSAPIPTGAFSYWKLKSGVWALFPSATLDSTRTVITLTLTADSSGAINDPGGPAIGSPAQPTHPLFVGGEMLPTNMLAVVAPWVVTLLVLTVVAVETLLVRGKQTRRNRRL